MNDDPFTACAEASRRASISLADHQDQIRQSRAALARAWDLIAKRRIYPYDPCSPHDSFDVSGLAPATPAE